LVCHFEQRHRLRDSRMRAHDVNRAKAPDAKLDGLAAVLAYGDVADERQAPLARELLDLGLLVQRNDTGTFGEARSNNAESDPLGGAANHDALAREAAHEEPPHG